MWNINNRLHTINKKYVYKNRKETTHKEIGERMIATSSKIYIYIYISIRVQGLLSQCKNNVSKIERKKKDTTNPNYIHHKQKHSP